MKKIIYLLLSIFIFFSCGKKEEVVDEEKKLKVWTYLSGNEAKVFQSQLDKFSKEKGLKIEAMYIPFGEYKKQLSVAVGAGTLPDIIMIDNPDHAQFATMGIFADISDKMKNWEGTKEYFDGPMLSTMLNGKHYGIPFTSNNLALFYNKKMLETEKVEVPTTWDELKITGKKLSKNGIYGLGVGSPKNEEATFQFLPWMLSAGGSYDKLNSEETIKAAAFWKELIDENIMPKEVATWGQGDAQKQFSAEKLAMFIGGPWMISQIKMDNPDIEFGVAFMPKDKKLASVLGGENLGITESSKDKDLAWELLKYIGDYKTVKEFIGQTGYFPPRKDVAKDPEWTNDSIKVVFAKQMEFAMPRGPHPKWPEISRSIYTALQKVELGTATPKEAFDEAQKEVDLLLK
ncbi:sugar ABC transporter substrate-binding protein [Oceanivirga salmonicida]|uniref:sugar ABC transporter substrate-binding protein n=1 Tax=Oceanivirga salmonicida TaxID=1769291 RepID=UPI0012E1EA11|nr:sugar ABC transporter substrate-binding protein [Oceanivirga salmonicida]